MPDLNFSGAVDLNQSLQSRPVRVPKPKFDFSGAVDLEQDDEARKQAETVLEGRVGQAKQKVDQTVAALQQHGSRVSADGIYADPPPRTKYAKPGPYFTTLPTDQERSFQKWVKDKKVPWQDKPDADYDMRGYFQALQSGDPNAKQKLSGFDGSMHFPDTYKTPYHKTFSNESRYALPNAPRWKGDRLVDEQGNTVADETPKYNFAGAVNLRPQAPNVTEEDRDWHLAVTPQEYNRLLPQDKQRVNTWAQRGVASDNQKRAAGQTEFKPDADYQDRMRVAAGLKPIGLGNRPKEDPFALLKEINAQPMIDPRRQQIRDQVIAERYPSTAGNKIAKDLRILTDPMGVAKSLLDPQHEINDEVERRLAADERSRTPEMIQARKKFGALDPTTRALSSIPATLYSDVLKTVGGVTSLGGIAPNKVSEYLNNRGEFFKEAQSNAPLTAAGEEVKRSLPEKVVSTLGEMGVGIGELVLTKKATGLSLSKIMAIETAAKTSDMPVEERAQKIAEAAAMGKILDGHLSRPASAALFGVPTAVQSGSSVLQGNMSVEDALLQTAIQAGTGLAMGGKPKGVENAGIELPSEQQRPVSGNEAIRVPDNVLASTSANVLPDQQPVAPTETQTAPRLPEGRINPTEQAVRDASVDSQPEVIGTVETPPHHSQLQNRRQRNTATGTKGQFKPGKVEPEETVRMYRGENDATTGGRYYTTDRSVAEKYANGPLQYVDIPASEAQSMRVSDVRPDEFHLNDKYLAQAKSEQPTQEPDSPLVREAKPSELDRVYSPDAVLPSPRELFNMMPLKTLRLLASNDLSEWGHLSKDSAIQRAVDKASKDSGLGLANKLQHLNKVYEWTDSWPKTLDLVKEYVERTKSLPDNAPGGIEMGGGPRNEAARGSIPVVVPTEAKINAPYETGKPITVPYTRNTEGAAQYAPGGKYNEVVPGRYMNERPEGYQPPDARWEQGEVTFQNPLVIESRSDDPSSSDNWKNVLAAKYGKSGKGLSAALRNDGYDGIITYDKYGTGEIVDLGAMKKPQPTETKPTPTESRSPLNALERPWAGTEKYAGPVKAVTRITTDELSPLNPAEIHLAETRMKRSGKSPEEWAKSIDLSEPVEATIFSDGEIRLRDGHHRYLAAKILGVPLNVELRATNTKTAILDAAIERINAKANTPETPVPQGKGSTEPVPGERQFPKSAVSAGLPEATDLTYAINTDRGAVERANTRIQTDGAERVAGDLSKTSEPSKDDIVAGSIVAHRMAADGNLEGAVDVIDDLSRKLTNAGQSVQAASLISKLSPEGVLLTAQRQMKGGAKVAPEKATELIGQAKAVREAEDLVAKIGKENPTIFSENGEVKPTSRKSAREKIGTIQDRLLKAEQEARLRIAETKAKMEAGELKFKNTGPVPGEVSQHLGDYAIIGASKLARKGITKAQWAAEMVSEFGEKIKPYLDRLYVSSYRKWESERQQMTQESRERGARKIDPDAQNIQAVINDMLDARTAARKARNDLARSFKDLNQTPLGRVGRKAVDVLNLPRALLTTADLSAGFRQGKMGLARHPRIWADAFLKQFKAFKSADYERLISAREADPDYKYARRAGLDLTSSGMHEEPFQSGLIEKIPSWLGGEVVRGSERAYNTMLDELRFGWFKDYSANLRKLGLNPDSKADVQAFEEGAKLINNATGRGNLGRLQSATPVLNTAFFSPRFWASRLKLLSTPLDPRTYTKMTPQARVETFKTLFAFSGLVASQLALAKLSGAKVSLDPDDPDFLKASWGPVHVDFSAGFQNHIRTALRLAKVIHERQTTGKSKSEPTDILGRYARSKEAPVPSLIHDLFFSQRKKGYGTDFAGQPTALLGVPGNRIQTSAMLKRMMPMVANDIVEGYQLAGVKGALGVAVPSTTGEGVSVYTSGIDKRSHTLSGIDVSAPKQKPDETTEHLEARRRRMDAAIGPAIDRFQATPEFQKLDDEAKQKAMQKLITQTRAEVQEKIDKEDGVRKRFRLSDPTSRVRRQIIRSVAQ